MIYAAFLRGIMPANPNMRNEKLKSVFESLGFTNVKPVISSGNIIFETKASDEAKLESKIEAALTKQLGINSTTFIRSSDYLEKMIKKDPFDGKTHSRESYLLVTFMKKKPHELYSELDVTKSPTPQLMLDIEKKYGKEVTSRTWKTIERIAAKMK